MEDKIFLTLEGARALQEEVVALQAKELAGKEKEQVFFSERKRMLSNVLSRAEVLPSEWYPGTVVEVGSQVTLLDRAFDDEYTYTLVHPFEADHRTYKLSSQSPLACALIGQPLYAHINLSLAGGELSYEITNILNCRK
ncbi:transcription elongation factor GreA [Fictibacillus macauensis ZFHKF-1]|uniref:Transcription elongation factor GreA n=1 Tax=Fictibacillus macauensis ZFHKF-1 TaxID=1196324 RepID=I8AFL0_9BACL|nr:GreA/GreB family elongation factor [Fictibacillus macauensis]EIT84154.1 transcription elongation factor GreA [Fictibacillus macauensis ZFHKF-1]